MKFLFLKLVFTACIVVSCNNPKKMTTQKESIPAAETDGTFDIQGHRGCRGLMPENSITGMIHALGLGVTTLEMDVVITKDKQVILSHEPFFSHEITTRPDGSFVTEKNEREFNIYRMNYDEVKQFDVGMKPHPRFPGQVKMKTEKPLLSAVFDSVKEHMMMARRPFPYYNIETKCLPSTDNIFHPGPAEFAELLMQVIREKNMEEMVVIQSFDIRTLIYIHQHYPAIKTSLLVEAEDMQKLEEKINTMGFIPDILSPNYLAVTPSLIQTWHAQKRKVIPWTVNDKPAIEQLKQMGVDGIITDYPDLFIK